MGKICVYEKTLEHSIGLLIQCMSGSCAGSPQDAFNSNIIHSGHRLCSQEHVPSYLTSGCSSMHSNEAAVSFEPSSQFSFRHVLPVFQFYANVLDHRAQFTYVSMIAFSNPFKKGRIERPMRIKGVIISKRGAVTFRGRWTRHGNANGYFIPHINLLVIFRWSIVSKSTKLSMKNLPIVV